MKNKKLWGLAGLLVLSMTAAGAVWAQEDGDGFTVTGSVKTGLRMDGDGRDLYNANIGTNDDGTPKLGTKSRTLNVYGYSDDIDDGTALRGDLGATWKKGNVGAKINLRTNFWSYSWEAMNKPDFPANALFDQKTYLSNAYGWVDILDKLITVSGGIIDDNVWGTGALGDTGTDTNYDAIKGFRVEVKPLGDALTIGAAFAFGLGDDEETAIAAGVRDADKSYEALKTPYVGFTFEEFLDRTVLGALYKSDLFSAAISFRGHQPFGNTLLAPAGADILFGVKISAVDNLLIVVDGQLKGLGINDKNYRYFTDSKTIPDPADPTGATTMTLTTYDVPTQEFYVLAKYKVSEEITGGLRAHFFNIGTIENSEYTEDGLHGGKYVSDEGTLDWELRAFGNYKITDAMTAGLELEFKWKNLTESAAKLNDDYKWGEPGMDSEDFKASSFDGFHIKPSLGIKLGDNLSFTIFDKISYFTGTGKSNGYSDAHYRSEDGKSPSGYLLNTIHIDAIWSF